MVSRALRITLGLSLFAAVVAQGGLLLKPQTGEYELDGIKFRRVVFMDGEQRVTYAPPPDWEFSGDNDSFVLHPKRKSEAEAIVTHVNLPKPQVFDDETMLHLTAEVSNSLPAGATHPQLVAVEKNPVIIEHKETFLVVINYDFVGQPQTRSVMFLNRTNEQIRFQLTCRRGDFKELQKAFLGSHFSWQNL
jgi:hypothetical protein